MTWKQQSLALTKCYMRLCRRLRIMDRNNFQMVVEVDSQLIKKWTGGFCRIAVPGQAVGCHLGPSYTEEVIGMIISLVCCSNLFRCSEGVYPYVEVMLVSAKSPGTNSPFNKMGVQKRTSYQDCYSSRGWVCLNCVRILGCLWREEKKKSKKNK